jgi:hypothetical protein
LNLSLPLQDNAKLKIVVGRIEQHVALETYWQCSNINAVDRLGYNDHGPIHIKIVANLALKLLRMLVKAGIKTSIEQNYKMAKEDAEIVVILAACLHDIGHIVHRANHEEFSVALAPPLINELLMGVYEGAPKAIMLSEILHAIYSHRAEIRPLTVEGGVVKIADALDMEQGRARIPFSKGTPSIHAVSAMAIEKVSIREGEKKPICIDIRMSNSAGIYQLDNLLKDKVENSGIKEYFEVQAEISGEEKKIVSRYEI